MDTHALSIPTIPEGSPLRDDGRPNYDYIRRVYASLMPLIMREERWMDTHFINWISVLTPIELAMWSLIRSQRVPYYPQFPVGRYVVDFGSPHHRIAIECDGKNWHDEERDAARDIDLQGMGWRVVRFSGRSCYRLPWLPDLIGIRGNVPTYRTDDLVDRLVDSEKRSESGEWCAEEEVD